jgi:hypothetical protein
MAPPIAESINLLPKYKANNINNIVIVLPYLLISGFISGSGFGRVFILHDNASNDKR